MNLIPSEGGIKTFLNFPFPRNPHSLFFFHAGCEEARLHGVGLSAESSIIRRAWGPREKFAGNMQSHLYYNSLCLPLSYMEALPLLTPFVIQFFAEAMFLFWFFETTRTDGIA